MIVSVLGVVLLFAGGCAPLLGPSQGEPRPSALEAALALAGDNCPELERFIERYPAGSERWRAARFLVAGLSAGDAVSRSTSELRENLEYAFRARAAMPWGAQVPDELFLRAVLPHRAGSEVYKPWRKRFFEELAPLVRGASGMAEAALRLNIWCLEQANYQATVGYPLAPVDVIARGYGRCGELSKLYVLAARSVGIPARTVLVPWWQHTESNHGWVEVWTGDGWHFLGASEPDVGLDRAWFAQHLGKAPLVFATSYGGQGSPGEPVYDGRRGMTVVNRTADYAPSGTLHASVTDGDTPVAGASVTLAVFNGGLMRAVGRVRTGVDGAGEITMGCGTYLAVVRGESGMDWALARVHPGERTELTLDLAADRRPEGRLELRYCPDPLPPFADEAGAGTELGEAELKHGKVSADAARTARLRGIEQDALRALDDLGADAPCGRDVLERALTRAGANWPVALRFAERLPERLRGPGCHLLDELPDKDLLTADARTLLAEVELAVAARSAHRWPHEESRLFLDRILPGRIDEEPPSPWREPYVRRFRDAFRLLPREAATMAGRWASELALEPGGFLASAMTPLEMLRAGAVRSEEDRLVAAGAVLRALGIPVIRWRGKYFDGHVWRPIPLDDDTAPSEDAPQPLTIRLRRLVPDYDPEADGEPMPAYHREFALARLDEEGVFRDVQPDPRPGHRPVTVTLDPGEYYLVRGHRGPEGRVDVDIRRLHTDDLAAQDD